MVENRVNKKYSENACEMWYDIHKIKGGNDLLQR